MQIDKLILKKHARAWSRMNVRDDNIVDVEYAFLYAYLHNFENTLHYLEKSGWWPIA